MVKVSYRVEVKGKEGKSLGGRNTQNILDSVIE